ncbi:MAG: hypothetical protein IPK52_27465 [Chloroflexi bacterium]|nr:hypothetical protein [Chloroflexota bacterium]
MNILTETCRQLSEALTRDLLLLLASAVATFDPYWNSIDEEEDYDDDPLNIALRVTRGAFPDVYAAAVDRLRTGALSTELDRLICGAITAKGIPLDDLYSMTWGIPLPAFGADLTAPEFYETHPDVLPLLSLFDIGLPDDEYSGVDVPAQAYDLGRVLASSLHEQGDPALKQVGWLIGWLFSCTGNSLVDCTDEVLADLEPLSWSKDDVEFAIEMVAEADGIMADAMAGLAWLARSLEFLTAIKQNVACIRQTHKKGKRNGSRVELEWPGLDGGVDGTAGADAGVLQLRADAA